MIASAAAYYFTGSLYTVLAIVAGAQLARFQRFSAVNITTQKLLHGLVLLVSVLRALFFFLAPQQGDGNAEVLFIRMVAVAPTAHLLYVLDELPGLVLVSAFAYIVL